VFIPLLRPGQPAAEAVTAALARAHVHGVAVDWAAVTGGGRRVELPTYAFQHQRYWPDRSQWLLPAGGDGAATTAEAGFWAAVEGGDADALAALAAVDAEQPLRQALPTLAAWRRRERHRLETARWRYGVTWAPVPDPGAATLTGTWLVLVPDEAVADLAGDCVAAVRAHGADVIVAAAAGQVGRERIAALISQALAEADSPAVSGVVSLLALDDGPVPGAGIVTEGLAGTLALVQALGDAGVEAPLWVLTRGAVTTGASDLVVSATQAAVWGLGRVAALEHPDRWGGLIDLPPVLDDRSGARLCAVLAGCGEDQVAVRPPGLMARRLTRAPETRGGATRWAPRGTVLVTGGTGAIGGRAALLAAARGAARVVLTSRSGPARHGAAALAAELAGAGSAVAVLAADVADRDQAAGLLAWTSGTGPVVSSVLHAAGVPQGTTVSDTTVAELGAVLAAKSAGAAYLDELTAGLDLDAFVLFSSIAATWGSGGQPAYAAANAYLDALAQQRRADGLAALSVAWGPWAGGGMTDAGSAAQLGRRGLPAMDPALAVAVLSQALDDGDEQLTVADVDWARFAASFTIRRPSPLIADLPEVSQALSVAEAADAGAADSKSALAERLAGLPAAEQVRTLTGLVLAEAAAVLGHGSAEEAQEIAEGRAFRDLGFDSLTAVEFRDQLSRVTGLRLPATLVFDYPTPSALAEYIWSEEFQEKAAQAPLLGELDKLESLLSGTTPDGETHKLVADRLRGFLSKWDNIGAQLKSKTVARKLESASDDEIFDFINKELGRS
jgi:NAD(P)-dependent dehydrogenase (short-subunit alcohol dehydrogenase family)/acyl carrier protein